MHSVISCYIKPMSINYRLEQDEINDFVILSKENLFNQAAVLVTTQLVSYGVLPSELAMRKLSMGIEIIAKRGAVSKFKLSQLQSRMPFLYVGEIMLGEKPYTLITIAIRE